MTAKKTTSWSVSRILLLAALVLSAAAGAFAAVDPITGAEPAEGFGAGATGGYGKTVVNVSTWSEFTSAINQSNVYIKLQNDLIASGNGIGSGTNVTIDGQGIATIWGSRSPSQRILEMVGKNIVVKDLRVRNAGDNIGFKAPGEHILVSHVSSSGSFDDGISIAYGTKNITVQYCFFTGNTRSIFIKYNTPQNISLHHNWLKVWSQRAPLVEGTPSIQNVDMRNHLNEDWCFSGAYFRDGATGNLINCMFVLTGATAGKLDGANQASTANMYYSGNAYRGCSGRPATFTATSAFPVAPVTTHSAVEAETIVRASAGCLPRDVVDLAYIGATSYPHVTMDSPWVIERPTVTGPASPTTTSPIVFNITFTGPVTGFTAAGITVTNGTKGALSGSGANYTLSVTPTASGAVTCKVNAGSANGTHGKCSDSETFSVTFTGSGVEAPTATVTGPASPTSSSPITFNITFSKPVVGFTADGITVANGTKGTLSGSGASYSIPVTPLGPGPVTCKVEAGAAEDGEGIGNLASNLLSVTYEAPDIPDDLPSWAHRQKISFAGYTGSETLTSFPLLVRLTAAQFPLEDFEPGGADLRFTDAGGNPLPYEIESWDWENGGESSIWVVVPQITSSSDYIEMLWGKPGALSRARPHRVWTNGFLGTWHLGNSFEDSSSAERHATNNGASGEDGLIGGGAGFDGASFVALPLAGTSESGSLSVWMKTSTSFTNRAHLFYLRGAGGTTGGTVAGDGYGGQNELHVDFMTSGTTDLFLNFFIEGEVGTSDALDVYATADQAYNDGQWYHIAATWEKPGFCYLYVNGQVVASDEHIGRVFNFDRFAALGKPETNNRYYTGLMDEARLESAVRSTDWVRACYLNQKRDSTFVVFGEAAPAATVEEWGGYR